MQLNTRNELSRLMAKKKLIGLEQEEERVFNELMQDPANARIFSQLEQWNEIERDVQFLQELRAGKKAISLNLFLRYAAIFILIATMGGMLADLLMQNRGKAEHKLTSSSLLITSDSTHTIKKSDANQTRGEVTILKNGRVEYARALPSKKSENNTIQSCDTANVHITLSDGSKIILNVNSRIDFDVPFNPKERRVTLTGEAYFEVASNPDHPFIVETQHKEIKVLGTSFNISSYDDRDEIVTTLIEGQISASFNRASPQKYETVLRPCQQLILNTKTKKAQVLTVDTYPYTAWTKDRFVYRHKELSFILDELSRWYNVKVEYENEQLKQSVFSLDIQRYKAFNEVLTTLEKTQSVKFNVINNNILVQEAKRN